MEPKIAEIAERIHALRDILGLEEEEMAKATGVSLEDYREYESGTRDFTFTFLYYCAQTFGVDMNELLTGEAPHLTGYTVVRGGRGVPIKRNEGFEYYHLAGNFNDKFSDPFYVKAPYKEELQNQPVEMNQHEGQEFEYVIDGSMKFVHNGHTEILNAGDSVYFDSSKPHGTIAIGGKECNFLAIILKNPEEKDAED